MAFDLNEYNDEYVDEYNDNRYIRKPKKTLTEKDFKYLKIIEIILIILFFILNIVKIKGLLTPEVNAFIEKFSHNQSMVNAAVIDIYIKYFLIFLDQLLSGIMLQLILFFLNKKSVKMGYPYDDIAYFLKIGGFVMYLTYFFMVYQLKLEISFFYWIRILIPF